VMINWKNRGGEYTTEEALEDFAVGFIGDLAGGGLGELIAKYGSEAVAKGLMKIPGFNARKIKELTNFDIIKYYSSNTAEALGTTFKKADGEGYVIKYGKYTIRIMSHSRRRPNQYLRISYGDKGSIDHNGMLSDSKKKHILTSKEIRRN